MKQTPAISLLKVHISLVYNQTTRHWQAFVSHWYWFIQPAHHLWLWDCHRDTQTGNGKDVCHSNSLGVASIFAFFGRSKTSTSHLLLNYVGHNFKKYLKENDINCLVRWNVLLLITLNVTDELSAAEHNTPVQGQFHRCSLFFVSDTFNSSRFPPVGVSLPHRLPSLTLFVVMLQYDKASCCGGLSKNNNNYNNNDLMWWGLYSYLTSQNWPDIIIVTTPFLPPLYF